MSFAKVMKCPVCNEEINAVSIRCRSCGSLLSEGATSGDGAQRFKIVLLIVGIAAASLTAFTMNKAGKADIPPQSVAGDQTTPH